MREPLTRARILRAALALVDEHGVDALTMRRLGEALGFEAMSLYRHVQSKDDLLDGTLDLVLEDWELARPGDDVVASVRPSALSVYRSLHRHPWAAALVLTGPRPRPGRMRFGEALLAALRAHFDATTTYTAYHVLDAYIFGYSLWEAGHTLAAPSDVDVAEFMRTIAWDELPNFKEHADQHMTDGPHREVSAFELGLDLILEGLRTRE